MKTETILYTSFVTMIVATLVGSYLKILHYAGADLFLITSIVSYAAFIITALYEVHTSKKINANEKLMWTVGLLFIAGITGIVYVLMGRRRVVPLMRGHIQ